MNELCLFNPEEKMMSTKELADIFSVDVKTINNTVDRLGGLLGSISCKSFGGRPTKVFTEHQATMIKQEIQKHHNLQSRQVDAVTTEYEENQTIFNALQILQKRSEDLQNKLKMAEQTIEEQKPKADAYDHFLTRDQFTNFRDASNYLGISQTDFMKILRSKYIYKNSIGEYRAYSEYSKYFTLRPYDRGYDRTGQQLMLNINGLEYFKQKIF